MSKKRNIWVTPHDDGWAIRREGSERATRVAPTKQEAEKVGREIARNDAVEVIVQRRDGTIQSKDSYGPDPVPPKDKEH